MAVTWTVDTTGFRKAVADLARISGVTYEEALKEQTRLVMQAAMRGTPAAKVAAIRRSVAAQGKWHTVDENGAVLSENTGSRGGEAGQQWLFWPERSARAKGPSKQRRTGGDGGMFVYLPNSRLSPAMKGAAAALQAKLAALAPKQREAMARAVKARGLAKQSWLQSARAVGIELRDVPGYVVGALASSGTAYQNGTGRRVTQGDALFYELENKYPALLGAIGRKTRRGRPAGMDGFRILQSAIASRVSAFNREMKLGVIADMRTRAARYSGLRIV